MTGCYLYILYMLLSENILHSWQTTIFLNVNVTIRIKYTLTRYTETFTPNAAHLKQTNAIFKF